LALYKTIQFSSLCIHSFKKKNHKIGSKHFHFLAFSTKTFQAFFLFLSLWQNQKQAKRSKQERKNGIIEASLFKSFLLFCIRKRDIGKRQKIH
jgi:hypothetical protein